MGKVLCYALAFYTCSVFAQEVTVNKDGSVTLKLSAEEAKACKDGGGCVVMPVSELEPIIRETAKMMCGKSI
jgi:hypothetical protein